REATSAGSAFLASCLSMRTTSAPMSASNMPANGPGPIPANSTVLMPDSGPLRAVLPDGATSACELIDDLSIWWGTFCTCATMQGCRISDQQTVTVCVQNGA